MRISETQIASYEAMKETINELLRFNPISLARYNKITNMDFKPGKKSINGKLYHLSKELYIHLGNDHILLNAGREYLIKAYCDKLFYSIFNQPYTDMAVAKVERAIKKLRAAQAAHKETIEYIKVLDTYPGILELPSKERKRFAKRQNLTHEAQQLIWDSIVA